MLFLSLSLLFHLPNLPSLCHCSSIILCGERFFLRSFIDNMTKRTTRLWRRHNALRGSKFFVLVRCARTTTITINKNGKRESNKACVRERGNEGGSGRMSSISKKIVITAIVSNKHQWNSEEREEKKSKNNRMKIQKETKHIPLSLYADADVCPHRCKSSKFNFSIFSICRHTRAVSHTRQN